MFQLASISAPEETVLATDQRPVSSTPPQKMGPNLVLISVIALAWLALLAATIYFTVTTLSLITTNLIWILAGNFALTAAALIACLGHARRRYLAPLSDLTQSLANMTAGDVQTPIWGKDRRDMIGALARMADQWRRNRLEQTPDIVVATPDGIKQFSFRGAAAPLFESLKQELQHNGQILHRAANQLQAGVEAQQASMRGFADNLYATLQNLAQSAQSHETRADTLLERMTSNDTTLRETQSEALTRFLQIAGQIEKRAGMMDEILQLTGRQAATTLSHLQHSSHLLRQSANENHTLGERLRLELSDVSERTLAALALLRSSGKVLAETTEISRLRAHEILSTMSAAETALTETLHDARTSITHTADMATLLTDLSRRTETNAGLMAEAVAGLLSQNAVLTQQVDAGGQRLELVMQTIADLQEKFSGCVTGLLGRSEQLDHVLRQLQAQHHRLQQEMLRHGGDAAGNLARLAQESEQLIARIEAQLALAGSVTETELRRLSEATTIAAENAVTAGGQLTQATQALITGGHKIEIVADAIARNMQNLQEDLTTSLHDIITQTETMTARHEDRLHSVHGEIEQMSQKLSALGQLTVTLSQVAGQLGQAIPQLGGSNNSEIAPLRQDLRILVAELLNWQHSINAGFAEIPQLIKQNLGSGLEGQFAELSSQLALSLEQKTLGLSQKLQRLDEVNGFIADYATAPKQDMAQLVAALRGIITALTQINDQLHVLDDRLPERHEARQPVDQALSAVTDIFVSLRDRGDDVINRLHDMANQLQSAAENPTREQD
jgi:hypothetical protein